MFFSSRERIENALNSPYALSLRFVWAIGRNRSYRVCLSGGWEACPTCERSNPDDARFDLTALGFLRELAPPGIIDPGASLLRG